MDRFSSWLTIALLVDKRSATVIDALLLHVVWKLGYFSELTIDSEKGFQSAAFDAWAESMGIRVRQPLAYSPTGNASGEVGWKHIVTSDVRFPPTQQRLNEITFAWNTQTKASTQMVTQPPSLSLGATQGWSHSLSLSYSLGWLRHARMVTQPLTLHSYATPTHCLCVVYSSLQLLGPGADSPGWFGRRLWSNG